MKVLVIINTILILAIYIKIFFNRITISLERTFWEKRIIGINITLWEYSKTSKQNSGRSIIYWIWGNRNNDNYNKRKP